MKFKVNDVVMVKEGKPPFQYFADGDFHEIFCSCGIFLVDRVDSVVHLDMTPICWPEGCSRTFSINARELTLLDRPKEAK